jgi:hypothetical protein
MTISENEVNPKLFGTIIKSVNSIHENISSVFNIGNTM